MLERLRDKCAAVRAQAARAPSPGLQPWRRRRRLLGRQDHAGVSHPARRGEAAAGAQSHIGIARHLRPHHPARRRAHQGRRGRRPARRLPGAHLQGAGGVGDHPRCAPGGAARARRALSLRARGGGGDAQAVAPGFRGDALALLAALDAESNEAVAEAVVKELIRCGKIKAPRWLPPSPKAWPPAIGCAATPPRRRAGWREDPSVLMTPEAAVYWRVVCEALHASATQSGATAAHAGSGRTRLFPPPWRASDWVNSAALPASAADLLVRRRARRRRRGVRRLMLLPLLSLLDLADATPGGARGSWWTRSCGAAPMPPTTHTSTSPAPLPPTRSAATAPGSARSWRCSARRAATTRWSIRWSPPRTRAERRRGERWRGGERRGRGAGAVPGGAAPGGRAPRALSPAPPPTVTATLVRPGADARQRGGAQN